MESNSQFCHSRRLIPEVFPNEKDNGLKAKRKKPAKECRKFMKKLTKKRWIRKIKKES